MLLVRSESSAKRNEQGRSPRLVDASEKDDDGEQGEDIARSESDTVMEWKAVTMGKRAQDAVRGRKRKTIDKISLMRKGKLTDWRGDGYQHDWKRKIDACFLGFLLDLVRDREIDLSDDHTSRESGLHVSLTANDTPRTLF